MPTNIAFEKFTLSNGLEVILHEDHTVPVTSVNVWYHVGSQNEEADRTGFAHLFEHIMFKGSKHHNREYFMPLQEVGASVNGSTTNDRTNYYENVPAEYLELALWLESDRMGYLLDALDQTSFDVERDVVKNERRQSYENRPYGLAGQEIRKALYPPNHPYHWQTIGSQEHLDAASLDDVKAFFRRFYNPNNASLAIAGDIDPAETKALVQKYFGDLPPGPPLPRIQRWLPRLDDEVRLELEDRVQLQRIYFAWVGPPRFDPDQAPLDILVSILGEGHTARLYRTLVYDKQLAREVNAHYGAMEIAGELRLDASVTPGGSVEAVERALLSEVERMQDEPPTAEEIERAMNRLEARRVRALESVGGFGGRANLLNHYNVFAGDPGRLNEDFERYAQVTPADVQRVARTYFGSGRVRLVVSPAEAVAPAATQIDRTQQPGPGRVRSFRPPVPERLKLSNGLDLLVVERCEVPTIAAAVYFPGGAVTDPADRPGLASLTARLLTEGTRSRDSMRIADESEFIAARLSVSTHRESVLASTEVLTQHWPKALDLLADVLANPVYPEREVERIRKERITDLRRLKDDASAIADRVANGTLYGRETPQGHPSSGRESTIAEITRDELIAHHARSFTGARPSFLLVGDISAQDAARQLEAAFSTWRANGTLGNGREAGNHGTPSPLMGEGGGGNSPSSLMGEGGGGGASPQATQPTTIYLVDKPGAAQSVISAGQLTVPRVNPDYLPLVVMNMAFGGQYTARLNMNLREDKGYTYGYRSRFDWRLGQSNFAAGGSVQTAVTKEALLETLKEFRDLVGDRPVSADEFEKGRLGLIRGYPPTFETPGQILSRLYELVHYGLPDDYFTRQVAGLEAVTLADVHRAAAEYVDPNALAIVVVGDRAVIEPGLRELGVPIVHLDFEGLPLD